MAIDVYITADKYRDTVAWWSWVRQGKTFAFANSASNTGSTTVASAAAASTTSITVSSGTGFAASDTCLIRSASSDDTFELVKISAISINVITITAGLKYAYGVNSIFRHSDYWGSCVVLDKVFNPVKNDAGWYNHTLRFTENL